MPQLLLILVGAGLTLVSAYSLGQCLLRSVSLPRTLVFGLGAAILSLGVFLLLSLRIAVWPVFLLLAAGLAWAARWRGRQDHVAPAPGMSRPAFDRPWESRLLAGILVVYGGLYLVHALAPEIQPDAVTYHLGLPREYVKHHGFTERVAFHEVLPQGMEMLFTMGYAFGRHSAAKLIHFAFLAATFPLMIGIGRRLGAPDFASAVGACLYLLSPVVATSGTSAYTDAALVFYSLAAAYALMLWRDSRHSALLGLTAGILAGFCYAVKMNGMLVPAACFLFVAAHRKWRPILCFSAGAALMIAPWMLRSLVLTGNPLAPLFNEYFANGYFFVSSERRLIQSLRTYPGLTLESAPMELTTWGSLLQGLAGPVFLLAPAGVLALRRRRGWVVAGAALLLAIPWFLNMGTRFLMPSLPWLCLLMAMALPRLAAWGLLAAHAVLCLPPVVGLYADETAWRLKGLPLAAALRLESEHDYLSRNVWGFPLAEMVERNTSPNSGILDFVGLPTAYLRRKVVGDWQSAEGERLAESLAIAAYNERGAFQEVRAGWKEQPLRALRIQWADGPKALWNIHEIRLFRGAKRIRPGSGWLVDAEPNVWEAEFGLDGNLVSRWSSREAAAPGMFFEVEFPRPVVLSAAMAIMASPAEKARIGFLGMDEDGKWRMLPANPETSPSPALNLRREAIQFVKRRGIRFVVARSGYQGHLVTGRALTASPGDWGVVPVATYEDVVLFRIR